MSNVCTDPSYTCGDIREAVIGWDISHSTTHTKNRKSVLVLGASEIVLNQRKRDYLYDRNISAQRNNFKYVLSNNAYFECYDLDQTDVAGVSDRYETVDSEIKFLDLRNDIVVYERTDMVMEYEKPNNTVMVWVNGTYEDVQMHPFIFEEVPITGTRKLVYLNSGVETVLYEEAINSGYWNGIRLLMPLFDGGIPYGEFTYEGTVYNASDVDWYYIPNHMAADGGVDLYWPDWLKAVGVYNDLDEKEAEIRWAVTIGPAPNPTRTSTDDELHTSLTFDGSVTVDREGRVFYSIMRGDKVFNFLTGGDPVALAGIVGDNPGFYPVGVA